MKKIYSLIAAIAVYALGFAQIPNAGFENWTSTGSYEDPDGWATMNFISVSNGHTSCEKSTDSHSGSYALKVTNNTSLGQMQGGWGIVASGGLDFPFKPAFAVSGHPTTLGGWYKFNPLSGDTGMVMVVLFYQGSVVSQSSTALPAATSWTQFSHTIDNYNNADSATLLFFAFRSNGPNDPPNGNSSLWVDDITFGGSTGIGSSESTAQMVLYPNPAQGQVTFKHLPIGAQLNLINMLGEVVLETKTETTTHTLDVSSMPKGMYLVQVKNGATITTHRLVLN